MNRIILLLKYSLKLPKTKSKIQIPTPLKYLIFVLVMFMVSGSYAGIISEAYGFLAKMGKQTLLIDLILSSGCALTLLIGFFNVINTFFLAEDTEAFLALPFKASEIVFSKLLTTLGYLYVYSIIIILPLIAYGAVSNAGWVFYIYVACAYIFNPVIPMIFAFIISSILMSLGNLTKHKEKFKVIFTILLIALIVGFNLLSQGVRFGGQTAHAIVGKETLIKIASLIFINVKLESVALAGYAKAGGILNILAVLLIVVVLMGILYVVSEKLYLKGLKSSTDLGTTKKKEKKVIIRETSVLKALIFKEFKVIFRTSAFLINSVVMLFYIPVLYVFIIFSSALGSKYWHFGFVVVGASMLAIGIGMSSGSAASTALSREGNNILVSKYIPVSYKTQILAKLITSSLINSLIVLLGIGLLIFEKVRPEIAILSIIIQVLTCLFMTVVGIFTDYLRPRVSWETEKNLFKGNFRNLGNIILSAILGGIMIIIAFVTKSVLITFLINAGFLVIAIAVIMYILMSKVLVNAYKSL